MKRSRLARALACLTVTAALLAPAGVASASGRSHLAVDCTQTKCIALTFDDGPIPETDQLLDVLRDKNVRATFFVIGERVRANPTIVRREVADGHEIGNHSYTHPHLPQVSKRVLRGELNDTQWAVWRTTGLVPQYFRPPYGEHDATTDYEARKQGLSVILWDVDSHDWDHHDPTQTHDMVLAKAQPGSIVLLHEVEPATLAATGGIIDDLRAQGYTLVTLSQLFGNRQPYPGEVVYNGPRG